jgi:RNA polymerase sigma factor (sigma-70 family)
MPVMSTSIGDAITRLLPRINPDAQDRALAWNQWLSNGGAEPVHKFIRWSNGSGTDDDEIFQDAIITAYLKVERGEYEYRDVPFTAFVKKIAWYKILEAARGNRSTVSLEDVAEQFDEDVGDTERVEFWREYDALHHALRQLPPRRSRVLLLYENGYTTSEIAEQLAIKEELVRKEKSLGLRQLKEEMALAVAT